MKQLNKAIEMAISKIRGKTAGKKGRKRESRESDIDIREIISQLPFPDNKKKEWLEIVEKLPNDFNILLKETLNGLGIDGIEELKRIKERAKEEGLPTIVYVVEVGKYADWEEVLRFWQNRYGIKYDNLFSTEEIINPFNGNYSKRVGEFLFGNGTYSRAELAINTPLDFIQAIKEIKKAFDGRGIERLKNENLEIVLVHPRLFELFEKDNKTSYLPKKTKAENLRKKFLEIIKNAIQLNASDIHFSPKKKGVEIKLRLYGDLYPFENLSHSEWEAMMRVIKTMARESGSIIDVSEWRTAQDAKIVIPEFDIDLRLAFTPSLIDNEQHLVIRLLYRGQSIKFEKGKEVNLLKELGYLEEDAKFLVKYVMTREKGQGGILIMAGATGSGKSKTLNTLLVLIPPTRSIKTIENPVEYKLPNADQHEVMEFIKGNEKIEFGFLQAVKEFMRQDPDVIFVGEWRKDPELTSSITYATKTGHFVLTTLHSSRVVNIPDLLLADYKVDKPTQANTLSLLISQRLLKTACPYCSSVEKITSSRIESELDSIQFLDKAKLYQILDAFENPQIEFIIDGINLKKDNRISLKEFKELLKKEIKVNIPAIFGKPLQSFAQAKQEKRVHQIKIERYQSLLTQMLQETLALYGNVLEKLSKKEKLSPKEEELKKRLALSIEKGKGGKKQIVTSKFVKYCIYPLLRENEKIGELRDLVIYYSPKINPEGCEHCKLIAKNKLVSAGISGRTPIYEYLLIDTQIRQLLFQTTQALEIEKKLIEKNTDFIKVDKTIIPKGKTFIDTFVSKLKNNYKWAIPFSELLKLK